MSVQYTFNLGTPEPCDSFIGVIARESGMRYDMHGVYPGGIFPTLEADGITAAVLPQTRLGEEMIRELYGFSTSVCISCAIDKFDLYNAGMS